MQELRDLIKSINALTEGLNIGDRVRTSDNNIGIVSGMDNEAGTVLVNIKGKNLDYFEDELQPFAGDYTEVWAKILYDGKEVNSLKITRFVGNIIPEDFDKNKFSLEIELN